MLEKLTKPAIFAHRGASAHAPENTMAAFELAFDQGADALEFDVMLSVDGEVVIIHDPTVDRTTTGTGYVKDMSYRTLSMLDAGSFYNSEYRGETIPTLEQVLLEFGSKIFLNIELKNDITPFDQLPTKVIGLIKQYNLQDQVLLSSFNPIALIRSRRQCSSIPIGLLANSGWKGATALSWPGRLLKFQAVHPYFNDVTAEFVQRAHNAGYRVHAYTVNHEEDMQKLFAMRVDGIYTNDPPLAMSVREKEAKHYDPKSMD